jgi:hypothetical protein
VADPKAYWEPLPGCPHGIVRVYSDGSVPFGHPYDFCCTVEGSSDFYGDRDYAEIKGLRVDGLTVRHQRAIFACLRAEGFDEVTWTRLKVQPDGSLVERQIRCRLYKETA